MFPGRKAMTEVRYHPCRADLRVGRFQGPTELGEVAGLSFFFAYYSIFRQISKFIAYTSKLFLKKCIK